MSKNPNPMSAKGEPAITDATLPVAAPEEAPEALPMPSPVIAPSGPIVRLVRVKDKPVITGMPWRNGQVRATFEFNAKQTTFEVPVEVATAALRLKHMGETGFFEVAADSPTKLSVK